MNANYVILITVAAGGIAFVAMYAAALKLAKKKVDVTGTLEKVGTGIGYAQAIATAISPFLPDVADGIIAIVLSRAQQAVTHVEATYKAAITTGATANDTRTAEATSLIKSALALEGIESTEQIDKLIGTVIPLLVLALPKTHGTTGQVVASGTTAANTGTCAVATPAQA